MASRPVETMPADVLQDLEEQSLLDSYNERPFYQRNDFLSWIGRAKRPETRQRRLQQMLIELEQGGLYMGMRHTPSSKA